MSRPVDQYHFDQYHSILLDWAQKHGRDFVWRHSEYRTPYRAAIAELMLRRTRADQVVPVYLEFLSRFPTLADAAGATPSEIKEVLYPLGLVWRADNIVEFLREARANFGEDLPASAEALQALPGVGDYVGAAVQVFAGRKPAVLIDVNVVRVLGRLFGLDYSGEARRRKEMRELALRAMDQRHPAEYHYAVLDFAAKVCIASKPRCGVCPFAASQSCHYYLNVVAPANEGQSSLK